MRNKKLPKLEKLIDQYKKQTAEKKLVDQKFWDELLEYIQELKSKFQKYISKERKIESLLKGVLRSKDMIGKNNNSEDYNDDSNKIKLATEVAQKLIKDLNRYYQKWEENETLKQKL